MYGGRNSCTSKARFTWNQSYELLFNTHGHCSINIYIIYIYIKFLLKQKLVDCLFHIFYIHICIDIKVQYVKISHISNKKKMAAI